MSPMTADGVEHAENREEQPLKPRSRRPNALGFWKPVLWIVIVAAAVWLGFRAYRSLGGTAETSIPTARVKRGDLSLSITAKGRLARDEP